MDFRILGPLEVVQEGRALPLGAAKQRALLAILVLHANQVVSVDRLIDLLWGEEPPETAANTLQVYVSGLRKVLEPARSRGSPGSLIVRRSPGYSLLVDPDELDSQRFERLVERAMSQPGDGVEARAAQLRAALALWRGPALADFAYEAFAQAEISRLEEMRMDALEARIEADLALGRHATLLGELDSLAALHPLREALRAQQMVALYRSGRQADALAVYAATRRVLDEELGIDPSTRLQRLEQQILLQDEALDAPARPEPVGTVTARPPAGGPGTAPTRKLVTILCCDLEPDEGLDPEARRAVVDRLQRTAIATLESHGAITEVTPDDRVVGVFGIPIVHEDDTVRAARAATEVLGTLPSLEGDLSEREGQALGAFGIATGEVVTTGMELPRGGVTKEAAALATAAAPGEVLLTEEARRNLGSAAPTEELPASRRRDRATRAGAFLLAGSVRPVSDSGRRLNAPMVGRRDELAGLSRAFERALSERTPHLFTLLGDAGVGKSRLLAEFVRRLADRAEVLSSRCPPYGEGLAFLPASDIVKQAARLGPELEPDEARARIRSALGDHRDASVLEARLVEIAGFDEIEGSVEELAWAVRKLLESQARRRPVVVVLDDVHWAEPSVLDLVEHIADWARGVPLLLVCSARPEFLEKRSSWGGEKLNATSMLLEPLSDGDCMTLLDNLFGVPGTPSEIRRRIVEAAEGNPLFVEEMARMLVDDGHLRCEAGQWIVASDISSVRVPPTIHALIAARLDRLEGVVRTVLQQAAVVGKDFSRDLVEHLGDPEMARMMGMRLRELVRKELIRPYYTDDLDEERYRFRHILIRDAAYSQMPKRKRAELHVRLADRLAATGAPGEIVAFHLERAFLLHRELKDDQPAISELGSRAAELLGVAAHAASGRGDLQAAAAFLERAVALVERRDRRSAGLLLELSDALAELGELRRAQELLRSLLEGTEADELLRTRARIQLWEIRSSSENVAGWKAEATRDLQEATALFRRRNDHLGLAKTLNLEALIDEYDYRFGESAAALESALEHARRAGDEKEETKIFYAYVRSSLFGPVHVDEALARYAQFRARFPDNRLVEANCLRGMALLEAMKGRFEEALALLGTYRELLVDLGLGLGASKSLTPGMVEMLIGDYEAAERTFRKGYDELGLAGERNTRAITAAYLARALYEQGRRDEAHEMTKVSEELAPEDDFTTMIEWASVRAKVLARRGEGAEADLMTRRVVALAAETDELETRATTLLDRAEVLRVLGRPDDATPCIEEALELYARKGDVASAARARSMLEAPLVIDLREHEAVRR